MQYKQSLWNYSVRRKADGESFSPRERTRRQCKQNLHRRKLGWWIWTMGYWRSNWWTRLCWWKIMFLDMGRQRACLAVQNVAGSPSYKEEEVKEKAKAKVDSRALVRHTLVKKKHEILNGGQKKTVFGGPRAKKARKALRNVRTTFLKVILVPIIKKGYRWWIPLVQKEEARIRREKEKKVPFPDQDLLPRKHLVKKDVAILGNLTIGIPVKLMLPQIQP